MDEILIYSSFGEKYREAILKHIHDIKLTVALGSRDLPEDLGRFTILLAWLIKPEVLQRMKSLKWIHSLGAGVDPFFKQENIISDVTLTRSVANLPRLMAQYSAGVILNDNIGFDRHGKNQSEKNWAWEPFYDICRKTAVIIGTGAIGSEIARTLKFFGLKVAGVNRTGREAEDFNEIYPVSRIDSALREADYVIIAAPLTAETRGLIDKKKIAQMKPSALLCNIARGAIIVEKDLMQALNEGLIRKAVLDVFEKEPLSPESPLWDHPRVIVTPHIAGISDIELIADEFVQNYKRYINGEKLLNIVDKDRQY